jgi:hypothetical protein
VIAAVDTGAIEYTVRSLSGKLLPMRATLEICGAANPEALRRPKPAAPSAKSEPGMEHGRV